MSSRTNGPTQFLNGPNYQKIVGFLRHHYASKLGSSAIPERMDARLQKTVQHYMTEIARIQGATKPPSALNQEVVRETTASMDTWLRKQEASSYPTTTTVGTFTRPEPRADPRADDYKKLFEDTSTRYENILNERTPPAPPMPPLPDFRMEKEMFESEEDPVLLMQRMQKQRDEQSRAFGPAPKLEIKEDTQPTATNPIPPQAEPAPPLLAPRPQDYIIPQDDITKYRETEYNIFLTSSDRDWLRNTSENRYNFTVNFNTGSKKQGFNYNPALQNRFRNIQRIEFVKAIVPIESLTTLVKVANDCGCSPAVFDTSRVINVFSLPFVGVRISELQTNGFSTNPDEDDTFAIIQYDTTWSSDLVAQNLNGTAPANVLTKSGYTGMIPKFLKSQKVYSPTPLATLQRLSIRMERHNGTVLSSDSDVLHIGRICMSSAFTTIGLDSTAYNVNDANIENSYIFLQTSAYFPFSAVAEGDNIVIRNYTPATKSDTASDFASFINREHGHYVVAVGHVDADGNLRDGRNSVGYCNIIILRSRFNDPTSGSTYRTNSYFGGSLVAENGFATQLDTLADEPALSGCALINMSRQTHIVLRIITREYDSGSNIRPDNV